MPSKQPKSTASFPDIWIGILLGALSAFALIGLLSLGGDLLGTPFVPFDIFDWMSRSLPGWLIGGVIGIMVSIISFLQTFLPIGSISSTAKLAEQGIALGQLVVGGAAFGGLLAWLGRKPKRNLILYGQIGGFVLLGLTLIIEILLGNPEMQGFATVWLAVLFIGWGWGLAALLEQLAASPVAAQEQQMSRRQFLTMSGAGLAAAALGAWGVGRIFGEGTLLAQVSPVAAPLPAGEDPYGVSQTSGPAASPSLDELAARPAAVQGTRQELTSNKEFYRIDINTVPPQVKEETWRLHVHGMTDQELYMTLDEIRSMPSQSQILAMQCISNPVAGDLTSSTRWTGVRFLDLLNSAGLQSGAAGAYIHGVDGFDEFVSMEDIQDERCLLVYEMNGEPLPAAHGFPLRVYVPNRYGMKQPKWIQDIEIVPERLDGYWVVRGWDREAYVQTVSVVDTVVVDPDQGDNGMAMTGGIAWASGHGISKVEVKIDKEDWREAELIDPPLSPLTWVLWRYSWPYESGRHSVSVRAYDGNGNLQVTDENPPHPSGATGLHTANVTL